MRYHVAKHTLCSGAAKGKCVDWPCASYSACVIPASQVLFLASHARISRPCTLFAHTCMCRVQSCCAYDVPCTHMKTNKPLRLASRKLPPCPRTLSPSNMCRNGRHNAAHKHTHNHHYSIFIHHRVDIQEEWQVPPVCVGPQGLGHVTCCQRHPASHRAGHRHRHTPVSWEWGTESRRCHDQAAAAAPTAAPAAPAAGHRLQPDSGATTGRC